MDPLKKPVPSGLDRPVRQKVYRLPVDWRARGNFFVFCLMAAWLNEVVVRAVALLSALKKRVQHAYYSV